MRLKIIAVNALIVAIVGLLAFVLMRVTLGSALGNRDQLAADARHDVQGAAARLQLDGLRAERWLASRAAEPATVEPLAKATAAARGDAASRRCEELLSQMKGTALFDGNIPTLAALVDTTGKVVGRNGSSLGRGDDLAAQHPGLRDTLAKAEAGSDIWVDKDRYLASYVPVRDEKGQTLGALVIGRPLGDTLTRVSDGAPGGLVLVAQNKENFEIVGRSATASPNVSEAVSKWAQDGIRTTFTSGHAGVAREGDMLVGIAPLEGLGDGKRAVLLSSAPSSLAESITSLTMPILFAMALGLVLVLGAGWLLGNYVTRPIQTLEEGLLAILNGQTDRRFELDHPELGGLAFRIDQLLNQLMGVEEDNTDSEGRPSKAPSPANFSDAMSVDEKKGQDASVDPEVAKKLASEPEGQYYARLYGEYIAAKKALGEGVDHITEQAFSTRIQGMEKDAATKFGRPVRYVVQPRGSEVVLLAVPLPA